MTEVKRKEGRQVGMKREGRKKEGKQKMKEEECFGKMLHVNY